MRGLLDKIDYKTGSYREKRDHKIIIWKKAQIYYIRIH